MDLDSAPPSRLRRWFRLLNWIQINSHRLPSLEAKQPGVDRSVTARATISSPDQQIGVDTTPIDVSGKKKLMAERYQGE
jgi:hypothetical protein